MLAAISLILLVSCGGGGSGGFTESEKSFVHNLFLTEYLWASSVDKNINYKQYSTPQNLVKSLMVTPTDKWSFAMTQKEYNNRTNQKREGFGFAYTTNNFLIYRVLIDAPAYGKLKRGDKILKLNGKSISKNLLKESSHNSGKAAIFTLLRDGSEQTVTITPKEYTFKVALSKIITKAGKKIGYLRYDSFTSASVEEIENEFTKLDNANIDDLIIDLRYNGGGSVAVASILLDNITNAYPGERQVYLDWNDEYKQMNSTYNFDEDTDGNELDMHRVFFLTTQNSASASELVISALKPYLGEENVITIGDTTHGKPVGMSGRTYGENYYFLINFFVKNDNEKASSLGGIEPKCSAKDDISHQLGDRNETMLNTALYYIEHNDCP